MAGFAASIAPIAFASVLLAHRPLLDPLHRHRLDDAIDTLKEEEVDAIVNRHVSIEAPMRINYRLTVQVAAGLLALLVVAYLWIRHLRALNRRLAELSARLHEDIEARERVEQALKESEEKYRALVENARVVVLQWDTSGRITFIMITDSSSSAMPRMS